jgi:vWA-MoxR associated protein C-terminal domain/vWA-MoxR associated protein middle region 0
MCVELSEEEIGEPILRDMVTRADVASGTALLELIDQLLAREVALWVFAYTIADIYRPDPVANSLLDAVRSQLAEPVLTRGQRADLHGMCRDIAGLDVPRLFRMSIDRIGYTLRSDPRNLCAVLNELEEFQARAADGLHPIAVFVRYLAGDQPPESAERLRAWLGEFVGNRTPHVNALQSIMDGRPVPAEPGPWHCLVYLDPDGVDTSSCYVSIQVQEGFEPVEPLRSPDDVPCTEAEIRTRIGEALNSPALDGINPADVRVEFFLPAGLVNLPIDRWQVGAAGVPLGVQYQVVVRSLTRLQQIRSAHAYLRDKWPRTATTQFSVPPLPAGAGFPATTGAICWLSEQAADQDRARVFVLLTRPAGPVCVLLAEAPTSDRGQALMLALQAGIPVLLWSRHPQAVLSSALSGLLAGPPPPWLRDLPSRLLQVRADAAARQADEDDLAHNLTLVYDDTDRMPAAEFIS